MLPGPEEMRKRFHELGAARDEKLENSAPLRRAREKLLQKTEPLLRELEAKIKEAEGGLYAIDMERAALARALKGKTGAPPAGGA